MRLKNRYNLGYRIKGDAIAFFLEKTFPGLILKREDDIIELAKANQNV